MRVIARLDIKNNHVIKGIHLEGLRKVGNPIELANTYYNNGIDEIIFMDAVASLYDRSNLFDIIKEASEKIFVPIVIGGGLRNIEDIGQALASGADKVAINTAGIKNPYFLKEAVKKYGAQCIVVSIESKKYGNEWECYIDNGREQTGVKVLDWVKEVSEIGCGEILLTSIDTEGTQKGFDTDLIKKINEIISIPLIVSGGLGNTSHLNEISNLRPNISAVASAAALHYNKVTIKEIKSKLSELGEEIRNA